MQFFNSGRDASTGYNGRLFGPGLRRHLHTSRFRWAARAMRSRGGPFRTLLELGCFDGKLLSFLTPKPSVYKGFDANWEGGLDLARETWGREPGYQFLLARTPDEMRLDPGERFEAAVIMETLEHVPPELVGGYLRKIADHVDGPVFITVPNEIGPFFLLKWTLKRLLGKRGQKYALRELFHVTLGHPEKVERREHKGFDYRALIREVGEHFDVVSARGIPFAWLPKGFGYTIGIVAMKNTQQNSGFYAR
jgi:hypothetical protein